MSAGTSRQGLDVVVPAPGEAEAWAEAVVRHFHEDPLDERTRRTLQTVPVERRYAVRDGRRIVANAGILSLQMAVPGGATLPCAGITTVGVAQTHRRRGLLRSLLGRCLRDARKREEPVAALFASESAIYPRFGFGASVPITSLTLERAHGSFLDPVDPHLVEPVEPDQAAESFPAIMAEVQARTPGMVLRSPEMWRVWIRYGDPEEDTRSSPGRLVTVPGRGYASYRVRPGWRDGLPAGVVQVAELVATGPEAEQALWQHVADVDLTSRVEVMMRPEDDPLPLMLTDPLRARALPLSPLYTRLLDVVRCLEARAASADGRVVLGLADPFGDQTGTLSIESEGGRLACSWTEKTPQLSMTTDVLAALWLGGHRAARLRDARRLVEHDPGSVGRLDSMLVTERRPWTPFEF